MTLDIGDDFYHVDIINYNRFEQPRPQINF